MYTNRALCYLKLGQFSEAIEDCQQALLVDPGSVKGHFFMGQAHVELGRFDDALVSLKTGWFLSNINRLSLYICIAHELTKQQRRNFGEDITSAIRYAKKMVNHHTRLAVYNYISYCISRCFIKLS